MNIFRIPSTLFVPTFSLLLSCLFLPGCHENPAGNISAQVLKMIPLTPSQDVSSAPTYELGIGTFQFLNNIETLESEYFTMKEGGRLVTHGNSSEDASLSGEVINSITARLHHEVHNGIIVPKDYNSLIMLSSFYQMDAIIGQVEKITGINKDSIRNRNGKFTIFFEPEFQFENETLTLKQKMRSNAAFAPMVNQFILFPPSVAEQVPIGATIRVLAHEFGHALWDYIHHTSNEKSDLREYMNSHSIRGLNEGFADFISYTLNGTTDILGNIFNSSLGEDPSIRRNFSQVEFGYENIDTLPSGHDNFYYIGTVFARSLFETQKSLGVNPKSFDERARFTTSLVKAMQEIKNHLDAGAWKKESDKKTNKGSNLGLFFQALAKSVQDKSFKTELCNQLMLRFGTQGFPFEYRTECTNMNQRSVGNGT
jgi:hypothetical protein